MEYNKHKTHKRGKRGGYPCLVCWPVEKGRGVGRNRTRLRLVGPQRGQTTLKQLDSADKHLEG